MKLAYLAVAAVAAFSTPALAAVSTTPVNSISEEATVGTRINSSSALGFLTAGDYKFVLTLTSAFISDEGFAGITAKLIGGSFTSMTSPSLSGGTTYDAVSNTYTKLVTLTQADTYGFKLTGGTFDGSTQVSASFSKVSAVPGPEAGAGLGALAMGGVALYLKRRRKIEAQAA